MESTKKRLGIWTRVFGAAGIAGGAAVACAACCVSLPLIGPVLAWLGIAGFGAAMTGWYVTMAAAFAAGVGIFLLVRERRRSVRRRTHGSGACSGTSCRI